LFKYLFMSSLYTSLKFSLLSVIILFGCVTPSIKVTREQNRGDLQFNDHNYGEAIKHYSQMVDESRKLGIYRNPAMESDVYRKIANCYEMTGDYQSALENVRKAFNTDSLNNNLINKISDYRQEGEIFIYMGFNNKGIVSLEKALHLSEGMDQSIKNENKISIADNYLVLGQLYSVMGKPDIAIDYTRKALTLFGQANDKRGLMESELNLANVYSDLGDITDAQTLAGKSMKEAVELGLGTSRHNQLLASIASETGEYEDALRHQEKAMKEASDFGILGQVIWTTIGIGDIYTNLGDFSKAEKYYRDAKKAKDTLAMKTGSLDASLNMRLGEIVSANEYFLSQGSFTGEAVSSLRIADMLMQKGNQDSALTYLNLAEEKFKTSGNREGVSNVLVHKGRILVDKGDYMTAKQILESATTTSDFPETSWQAWFNLGRLYEKSEQNEKAAEAYRNSISIIEKIRGNLTIDEFKSIYFDNKREVYDRLLRILFKMNKPVEAFQVSEQARARAFYDILANKKIDFSGSLPGDLISLEQAKRIEIQKLYKLIQKGDVSLSGDNESRASGLHQLREALVSAQSEYEDILQKIKLHSPAYAEMVSAQPVNPSELRSSLDDNSAVIAYWISSDELIIWFITRSDIVCREVPINEQYLESLIEQARKTIESDSPVNELKPPLKSLYSLLVAPFESNLIHYPNLIIIPNGSLHFLPFQALVDRRGDYLIQSHNIIYEPSASVFMICENRKGSAGSRFFGMALSDLSIDNKAGLPGTDEELKKILPLFPDNLSAFGKQGTETFVKKNAGNYNFIHFATHGSYNYDQPLYSYLLFSPSDEDDGRLNVYEVFELNLKASLVTLSACETGLGNISRGDEIVGLSRAFLFAGSSSVIVSLWAVADYPTSILMATFYKDLRDHNLQEALSMAQRELIKTYPQPIYWSPFILIGNGKVISK
jgi:CHAT domain-containing protein/predicted negative regulator of RcsB-dependent stress response